MRAPRVLVNGMVLAQPMSGVRRHAVEAFSRAARLLREGGGELVLLTPRGGLDYALPDVTLERASRPTGGPLRPWRQAAAVRDALSARGPFDVVHGGHLPLAPRTAAARGARGRWPPCTTSKGPRAESASRTAAAWRHGRRGPPVGRLARSRVTSGSA